MLHDINLAAVIAAAFANVFIGSFWYSPFLLGKVWMREKGFKEEDFKKGTPIWLVLSLSFLFALIGALAITAFLTPESTTLNGAGMGAIVAIFWITASKANTGLFENSSLTLILVHAGYDIIGYTVMGAILGGMS